MTPSGRLNDTVRTISAVASFILIGVVSTAYDPTFPRVILGDSYVNMTLENIRQGDPMAVYKDPNSTLMFYQITTNNIKVSFMAFISGFLAGIGTVYIMFKNGIMLGAFQWFFHNEGILKESFLTIWIHGALEISGGEFFTNNPTPDCLKAMFKPKMM